MWKQNFYRYISLRAELSQTPLRIKRYAYVTSCYNIYTHTLSLINVLTLSINNPMFVDLKTTLAIANEIV